MIVINDGSVAKLLQTILKPEGQIYIAGNGEDGLQKVKQNDYSLIVSAMKMPMVDGLEFFCRAKEVVPDLNKKNLFLQGHLPQSGSSFVRMKTSDTLLSHYNR